MRVLFLHFLTCIVSKKIGLYNTNFASSSSYLHVSESYQFLYITKPLTASNTLEKFHIQQFFFSFCEGEIRTIMDSVRPRFLPFHDVRFQNIFFFCVSIQRDFLLVFFSQMEDWRLV